MNRTFFSALVFAFVLITIAHAAPPVPASFAEFDRKAREGEALSVVFFGGSLTWGANASDPQRTSWRALMGDYLRQKYPRAPFVFHDAAIGGTGSKLGMFRLDRDVLAHKPDLVFLDFTMNDGAEESDLEALASYEGLLRRMLERGIPVAQVFTCFKFHFRENFDAKTLPRYRDHQKLAEAYHTGTGDALAHLQALLTAGKTELSVVWPFDGAHPDDAGYRLFYEAVRDGFETAIAEKRVCVLPPEPVFSDKFKTRSRIVLVERGLPSGWTRQKTYRTALWFDGLSSRWMGDVAAFRMKDEAASSLLKIEFNGTFVGLFGEKSASGLGFKAKIDGQPLLYHKDKKSEPVELWPNDTQRFGIGGNLFSWIELSDHLAPGRHTLEIEPVPDSTKPNGELRIESVCVAGD